MATITISQDEYQKLKQQATFYERMASEIVKTEQEYPYDISYVRSLTQGAIRDYKKGKAVKAVSVDEAMKKFVRR